MASADYSNRKSSSSQIKVFIRGRPIFGSEEYASEMWKIFDDNSGRVRITNRDKHVGEHTFAFDEVMWQDTSQEKVFENSAKPLVNHVLEGYNGCIFAYGQTGSGKTYTMFGDSSSSKQGVIPRSVEYVFDCIKKKKATQRTLDIDVSVAMIEIYCEDVRDLGRAYVSRDEDNQDGNIKTASWYLDKLRRKATGSSIRGDDLVAIRRADSTGQLDIREDIEGNVYLKDMTLIPVKTRAEVSDILDKGFKMRATHETKMNSSSSRSHTVFMLIIRQKDRTQETELVSNLNLIDLAGSERLGKSESEGQRLKETQSINASLSALAKVITALDPSGSTAHIPFRDSKLTRILQNSLGGNSRTVVLATLNPSLSNYDECLCTLQFATRCRNVVNRPRINYSEKDNTMMLQGVIRRLQGQMKHSRHVMATFVQKKNNQWEEILNKLGVADVKVLEDGRVQTSDGTVIGTKVEGLQLDKDIAMAPNIDGLLGNDVPGSPTNPFEIAQGRGGDFSMNDTEDTKAPPVEINLETSDPETLMNYATYQQNELKRYKARLDRYKERLSHDQTMYKTQINKLTHELQTQRETSSLLKQELETTIETMNQKIATLQQENLNKIQQLASNSSTLNKNTQKTASVHSGPAAENKGALQPPLIDDTKLAELECQLSSEHKKHLQKIVEAHKVQVGNITQQAEYLLVQKDIEIKRFVKDFNLYHKKREDEAARMTEEIHTLYEHTNKLARLMQRIRKGEYRIKISSMSNAGDVIREFQIKDSDIPVAEMSSRRINELQVQMNEVNQIEAQCVIKSPQAQQPEADKNSKKSESSTWRPSNNQVSDRPLVKVNHTDESLLDGVVFQGVALDTDVGMLSTGDLRELVDALRMYFDSSYSHQVIEEKIVDKMKNDDTMEYIKSLEENLAIYRHSFEMEAEKNRNLRIAHESLKRMSRPSLRPLSAKSPVARPTTAHSTRRRSTKTPESTV